MRIASFLEYLTNNGTEYFFSGDGNTEIEGYSSLVNYKEGTFTWIKNKDSIPAEARLSDISLAITSEDYDNVQNVLKVRFPRAVFFQLIEEFYDNKKDKGSFVGQNTYISPDVQLGENVRIGHNCSIDGNIIIGDETIIENNVSIIGKVSIGCRCTIQSGVVIGHESVAYSEGDDHVKVIAKQYGGVSIGNDVRIQALAKVARGSIDDTVIMDGVIIGDGSEVAHNCRIGANTAILPSCILCGSVEIGENSYISAAYIKNKVRIGSNAYIGFGSVVVKDVGDDEEAWGFPARKMSLSRE